MAGGVGPAGDGTVPVGHLPVFVGVWRGRGPPVGLPTPHTRFLTELRRGDGISVCAVAPSAAVGTDLNSVVAGMNTSFKTQADIRRIGARGDA